MSHTYLLKCDHCDKDAIKGVAVLVTSELPYAAFQPPVCEQCSRQMTTLLSMCAR